jgi:hypothetical protein
MSPNDFPQRLQDPDHSEDGVGLTVMLETNISERLRNLGQTFGFEESSIAQIAVTSFFSQNYDVTLGLVLKELDARSRPELWLQNRRSTNMRQHVSLPLSAIVHHLGSVTGLPEGPIVPECNCEIRPGPFVGILDVALCATHEYLGSAEGRLRHELLARAGGTNVVDIFLRREKGGDRVPSRLRSTSES